MSLHIDEIWKIIGQETEEFKLILRNYAGDHDSEVKQIGSKQNQVVKLDLQACEGHIYVNY